MSDFSEDKSFHRPFICTKGLFSGKTEDGVKYTRVLKEEMRKQREIQMKRKKKERKREGAAQR